MLLLFLAVSAMSLEVSLNNQPAVSGDDLEWIIANSGIERGKITLLIVKSGIFDFLCAETMITLGNLETFIMEESTTFELDNSSYAETQEYVMSLTTVELRCASLDAFESDIFSGCVNLTSFTCPSLSKIGAKCFCGCSSLDTVSCPNLVIIDDFAFEKSGRLSGITLDRVEYCGTGAFQESQIERLVLPSVTYVGNDFAIWCHSLSYVDLPLLEHVSEWAFYDCISLTEAHCSSCVVMNTSCFDSTGITTIDAPKLASIGSGCFSATHLVSVSFDNVVDIGSYAFYMCNSLESLNLPALRIISPWCFAACANLSRLNCPSVEEIGEGAFYVCSSLEDLEIPKAISVGVRSFMLSSVQRVVAGNLRSIGAYAFSQCQSLGEVMALEVSEVGYCAFDTSQKLKQVYFGNIIKLGGYCFSYCPSLELVNFSSSQAPAVFENGCFYRCDNLQSISHDGCKELGGMSFESCSFLSMASFPSVNRIGTSCFEDCFRLENVIIPNVEFLGPRAFENCGLVSISIESRVEIDRQCFASCKSLASISISNISSLGPSCFKNCVLIKEIHMESLLEIPEYAFEECVFFGNISFPSCEIVSEYAFFKCQNVHLELPVATDLGSYCFREANLAWLSAPKVESAGSGVFYLTHGIEEIVLPSVNNVGSSFIRSTGVKRIVCPLLESAGDSFIENEYEVNELVVPNLVSLNNSALTRIHSPSLTTLELPKLERLGSGFLSKSPFITNLSLPKVSYIGAKAFYNSSLLVLNLPNVTSAGESCFSECANLTDLWIPKLQKIPNGAFTNCKGLSASYIIDLLRRCVELGESCFSGCNLKSVTLPSLTSLPDYAFSNCTTLESIEIPAVELGSNSFIGCTSLREVYATKATTIRRGAFVDCSSLRTIVLNSVRVIEASAFQHCSSLESLSWNTLTTLGSSAFIGCLNLKSIEFEAVVELESSVFQGCASLSVAILRSVSIIKGDYHFSGCQNLEKVDLRRLKSVNRTGGDIFSGCKSLKTIILSSGSIIDFDLSVFTKTEKSKKNGVIDITLCLEDKESYSEYSSNLKRMSLPISKPKDYSDICPTEPRSSVLVTVVVPIVSVVAVVGLSTAIFVIVNQRARTRMACKGEHRMMELTKTVFDDFG